MTGGRFAYAGIVVGLAVSIWANVAHAMTVPGGGGTGSLFLAAFWPLGLFLALEVLSRTTWRGGRGLLVARAGVGVVAVVAAAVSYLHLHGLLLSYGEGLFAALVGPLAIDGLMAVSAAALLAGDSDAPVVAPTVDVAAVTGDPLTVEPPADGVDGPDPAPVPVRRRQVRRRDTGRAKGDSARLDDATLLARIEDAVHAGQINADEVTGNRLRGLLGVGAARSARLADQWADRRVVRPLRAAVDA